MTCKICNDEIREFCSGCGGWEKCPDCLANYKRENGHEHDGLMLRLKQYKDAMQNNFLQVGETIKCGHCDDKYQIIENLPCKCQCHKKGCDHIWEKSDPWIDTCKFCKLNRARLEDKIQPFSKEMLQDAADFSNFCQSVKMKWWNNPKAKRGDDRYIPESLLDELCLIIWQELK